MNHAMSSRVRGAWTVLVLACAWAAAAVASEAAPPPATLRAEADRSDALWLKARGLDAWSTRPDADRTAAPFGPVPVPDDRHWRSGFGLPSPDRDVNSLLSQEGLLIAAGNFSRIGDLETPGLAAWNGSSWTTLGTFSGHSARDLAPWPGGFVVLVNASDVYRWDGTSWHALPSIPGVLGFASTMSVQGTQIAVSVSVHTQNESWRMGVFLYDGLQWDRLGEDFDSEVTSLAWYGGSLYAGGSFDSVGTVPARMLARWDGQTWLPAANGLPERDGYAHVSALTVFNDELIAAGYSYSTTDPTVEPWYFARWNGTRWAPLGPEGPQYPYVKRLRGIGTDLYAVGQFYANYRSFGIARWDGTAWHLAEDSLQQYVHDIADYQGELYAGGALVRDGSRAAPRIARRRDGGWEGLVTPDGSTQGLLSSGRPEVRAVLATGDGVIAAGRFEFVGSPDGWLPCSATATWTGTRWSSQCQPWVSAGPYDMALHEGTPYMVGFFRLPEGSSHVVRLVDGEWRLFGDEGLPEFPSCVASVRGTLVVGTYARIERWNGNSWDEVGRVTSEGVITSITEFGDDMVVGGTFEAINGVPCNQVAVWNPSMGWRPLGAGPGQGVLDLTARDGSLYAAVSRGISRWKNGTWDLIYRQGSAFALGWYRGRLVASLFGVPGFLGMLEADGTWHSLGSGLDGVAFSFAESGSSLFVGGRFERAGAHPSYGFAEYRDDSLTVLPPPPSGPTVSRLTIGPNPSAAVVSLSYHLAIGAEVRVEIHDLTGRLVDTPFHGYQSAGPQSVSWRPPGHARAGVYLATVSAAGSKQTVRVVRID